MDAWIRLATGTGMRSAVGVADYFSKHLQSRKEAGALEGCVDYLSRSGRVKPLVHNPDLWRELGWDPDREDQPPAGLLQQLAQGCDRHRRRLTRGRSLFRAPKEFVVTVPAELSQALFDHPDRARTLLGGMVDRLLGEIEQVAIRQRVGKDKRIWKPGRLLCLIYLHAENRAGEVHYHAHVVIFLPAKAEDGSWRTWDNACSLNRLSKPGGGREKATNAMLRLAEQFGLEVVLVRGMAGDSPRMVPGATIFGAGTGGIAAGSLRRRRREEILAAQELKRVLGGVVPLTPRDLELVRRASGQKAIQALPKERRRQAIAKKLNDLGLLTDDGCVLPKVELAKRLRTYERDLALAQVQLEVGISLPGPGEREKHEAAASLVRAKREHVAAVVKEASGHEVDLAASAKAARLRWTEDYTRTLLLVHQAGSMGLQTTGIGQRERNLLSKLKGAGHLYKEKQHGRDAYHLSEFGTSKLREVRAQRGTLVDALLPGVRAELLAAAGSCPGAVGGGSSCPRKAPRAPGHPGGADVRGGSFQQPGAAGFPGGIPSLGSAAPEADPRPPEPDPGMAVARRMAYAALGSESGAGPGALRHPAPGAPGVAAGPGDGVRRDAVPEGAAHPGHGPELEGGAVRRLEGNSEVGRALGPLCLSGASGNAEGRGLRPPAGDLGDHRAWGGFPALPAARRRRGAQSRSVPLGRPGEAHGAGGEGSVDARATGAGHRGVRRDPRSQRDACPRLARGVRERGAAGRLGGGTACSRDPRAIRCLGALDLGAAASAGLVFRPGVPLHGGGQPLLLGAVGCVEGAFPLAAPAGFGLRPGGSGLLADALRHQIHPGSDLTNLRAGLDPLRAFGRSLVLLRPDLDLGRDARPWLADSFGPHVPDVEPGPQTSWMAQVLREVRVYEASDPQDLRELMALWEEEIREVFPNAELDVLRPIREYVELPDGRLHPVESVRITREGIQLGMDGLEAAHLAAEARCGRPSIPGPRSLAIAERLFREIYNFRPLEERDLRRPWPERLGRLVRQGWRLLLDRAVDLADHARQVKVHAAAERKSEDAMSSLEEAVKSLLERRPDEGQKRVRRGKGGSKGIGGGGSPWSR